MKITGVVAFVMSSALILGLSSLIIFADDSGKVCTSAGNVNMELNNVTVMEAIDTLFKSFGATYYVEPGVNVSGKIAELSLKGITFDQALNAISDAAGISYSSKDGSYIITKKGENKEVAKNVKPDNDSQQYDGENIGAGPGVKPQHNQMQAADGMEDQHPKQQPQIVINQPGPTYYGSTGQTSYTSGGYGGYGDCGYGYGGGCGYGCGYGGYGCGYPVYNFGGMRVFGGYNNAVGVGGGTYITGFSTLPPPPEGWVSTDQLRLLRGSWAMSQRPYIYYGY